VNWIDVFKRDNSAASVADRIGMSGRMGGSYTPCPACRADKRSEGDRRGPVGLTGDRRAWTCHRCGAKGDSLDMLAYNRLGRGCSGLSSSDWDALREAAVGFGLLEVDAAAPDRKPAHNVQSVGSAIQSMMGGARRKIAMGGTAKADPATSPEEDAPPSGGMFGWGEDVAERCERALWADTPEAGIARDYLMKVRKLAEASIRAFGLGLYVDADGRPVTNAQGHDGRPWLTIPLVDDHERCVNVRYRTIPVVGTCAHCSDPLGCKKCKSYRVTKGRPLPLFGVDKLPNDLGTWIMITEGELDVVALHSYGFTAGVVSGSAGAGTWDDKWLDALEPYAGFVGMYDADDAGEKGWTSLVEKLGRYRCARAELPEKDANACLVADVSRRVMDRVIDGAKSSVGVDLMKATEYADELEMLISNPSKVRGLSTGSQLLDSAWGGVRPGVIVVSGESGQGKTTWATWLLDTLSRRGVPTLLTSFEQRPIGTVQKLLRLELGRKHPDKCAALQGDFTKLTPDERREMIEKIGERPLYILNHYGHLTPTQTIESLRYAARRYGVRVAMVDHLGFLVDPDAQDERRATDAVIRAMTLTAKELDITIFLIAHPSNIPRETVHGKPRRITARDLKGSSAIRQDADDVIIIEALPLEKESKANARTWPATAVHFDKVRSEFGTSGATVVMAFDPAATLYADSWDDTPSGQDGKLSHHYTKNPV
jgi:replicative DNA helicase